MDLPTERSAVLNALLGQISFRFSIVEMPVLPQSVEELVRHYNGLDLVDFAEPNYRMQAAAVPNDCLMGFCGVCLISMPRPLGTQGPIVVRLSWV